MPRLLAFALLGTAATFNEPSHLVFHITGEPLAVTVVHLTFHVVSGVAYAWAVVLFPDGELPFGNVHAHRWRLRAALAAVTAIVTVVCWRSSFVPHPPFFVLFFGILVPAAGFASQTARLRRPAGRSPQELAQSRLLRTALVPAMVAAALWLLATAATVLGGAVEVHADVWRHELQDAFPAVFAVVPVALLVGILRYRLFEIDTLARRTFLYGLLAGFVTVTYALLVTVTGALVGSGAWAAVLAMTLVALAVEPARVALHGVANRLVFGQQLSPAEALRSLADGLERLGPADELRELCRVVVLGTRAAASAEVLLRVDGTLEPAACYPAGTTAGQACDRVVPIGDAGEIRLRLHRGLRLRPHEERLLQDLAQHAGLMLRNAQLAAELARHVELVGAQAAELARSRARVVTAQDAERVRLERDLHDGAQQELIAVLVGPAARSRDRRERPRGVRQGARRARGAAGLDHPDDAGAVRRRPPGAAGRRRASGRRSRRRCRRCGGRASTSSSMPRCRSGPPLDVEAAVYYCCQEAMQNAAKHARGAHALGQRGAGAARSSRGRCATTEPASTRREARAGSGLEHMAARLAVLGGSVAVQSEPGSRDAGARPGADRRRRSVTGVALDRLSSPSLVRAAIVGAGVLLTALAVTTAATATTAAADGAWRRPPLWALAVAPLAVVLLLPAVRRGGDRLAARLLLGDDADAYAEMAAFSSRIANTLAVDDVLPRLAEAAARTVHGEGAEVELLLDEGRSWRQVWPPEAATVDRACRSRCGTAAPPWARSASRRQPGCARPTCGCWTSSPGRRAWPSRPCG